MANFPRFCCLPPIHLDSRTWGQSRDAQEGQGAAAGQAGRRTRRKENAGLWWLRQLRHKQRELFLSHPGHPHRAGEAQASPCPSQVHLRLLSLALHKLIYSLYSLVKPNILSLALPHNSSLQTFVLWCIAMAVCPGCVWLCVTECVCVSECVCVCVLLTLLHMS